jgi:N-methylhydantoinase A
MCSALGMLVADLRIDKVTTYPTTSERVSLAELADRFQDLIAAATADLAREGFSGQPQVTTLASMRYLGQNYEEDIPIHLAELHQHGLPALFNGFHQHHQQRYGYHIPTETIEIVALKVTALGPMPKPQLRRSEEAKKRGGEEEIISSSPLTPRFASLLPTPYSLLPTPLEERQVYFKETGWLPCPVYEREDLTGGMQMTGPAIVEEFGCTTLLEPGQQLRVDKYGILTITG